MPTLQVVTPSMLRTFIRPGVIQTVTANNFFE